MKNFLLTLCFVFTYHSLLSQSSAGDCKDAIMLCNNDPIQITSFSGKGKVINEVGQTLCSNSAFPEDNGVWIKFKTIQSGEIAFNISPNEANDDIDFVVFKFDQSNFNCDNKNLIRCVASGWNLGGDPISYKPCSGITGLRNLETDKFEKSGCQLNDNNFAQAIQAESGDYYSIFINNYGSTNGALLEFTGDAIIGGNLTNEIIFTNNNLTEENQLTFSNSTKFNPNNSFEYLWDFGPNAIPNSATGFGPHKVKFLTEGNHLVEEKIITMEGCAFNFNKSISISNTATTRLQLLVGEIYPNPFSREAFIKITSPKEQNAIIRINNNIGQTINQIPVQLIKGEQTIELDLKTLTSNQSYMVNIEIDKKIFSRKAIGFIKQ